MIQLDVDHDLDLLPVLNFLQEPHINMGDYWASDSDFHVVNLKQNRAILFEFQKKVYLGIAEKLRLGIKAMVNHRQV